MNLPIFGKKTVLFPVEMVDFNYFSSILNKQNRKRLCNFIPDNPSDEFYFFMENMFQNDEDHLTYIARIIQGKASKNIGMFYIYKFTRNLYQFIFLPDPGYLNGLKKRLENDSNPFIEDCLKALIETLKDITRIEIKLPDDDKLMSMLLKKSGFKKEGTLRKYSFIDDTPYDVCVYSLIKA